MFIFLNCKVANEESAKLLNDMIPAESISHCDECGIRFEHPRTGVSRDVLTYGHNKILVISEPYNNEKITEPREKFRYNLDG